MTAAALLLVVVVGIGLWVRGDIELGDGRPPGDAVSVSDLSAGESASDEPVLPAGVTESQYRRGERMFREIYPDRQPDHFDTVSMAGELAVVDEQSAHAVAWFREIPTDHPRYGLPARLQEGAALIELDRLVEAEASLREYWREMKKAEGVNLQQARDAFKRLEYILSLEIRLEERSGLLKEIHQAGLADIRDSKHLFFPNLLLLNSTKGREKIRAALEKDPDSRTLRLAHARYQTFQGAYDEAITLLKELRGEFPENRRVMAYLLEAYFESGRTGPFEQLAEELPPYNETEPWLLTRLRGEDALADQRFRDATAHFENVLAADPANAAAQMGLANAWGGLDETEKQEAALERSSVLAEIRVNLNNVQSDAMRALRDLAEKCRKIEFEPAAEMFALHARALAKQTEGSGDTGKDDG